MNLVHAGPAKFCVMPGWYFFNSIAILHAVLWRVLLRYGMLGQIQGVPEVLKHFRLSTVGPLVHQIGRMRYQKKANECKFCIFMCGTLRQSSGLRCETLKNQLVKRHFQ